MRSSTNPPTPSRSSFTLLSFPSSFSSSISGLPSFPFLSFYFFLKSLLCSHASFPPSSPNLSFFCFLPFIFNFANPSPPCRYGSTIHPHTRRRRRFLHLYGCAGV
ncbi:hypothetical protein BDQ12DRAFT_688309 [Crucibulum laeve]|uniref:Uncharacterized protein n=1 Tax=Crucibulum laeve TaxID=68775 RepID=A0A5C3M2P4_9AGAR|nr:hypothetical protein BDQ12DRAFT_688309 [Crucibulum laeve]